MGQLHFYVLIYDEKKGHSFRKYGSIKVVSYVHIFSSCISKLEKLHKNSIFETCVDARKNFGEPETGSHILFSNASFTS